MFTICQDYYAFGVEVYFTRMWDSTWRVSDCEELVGAITGDDGFGFRVLFFVCHYSQMF
jgi:hypothetical protein